jgi:hypothetical protein
MGSTPQGVTTCCPTSGVIPDPLGEGGNKSVFPTVATGPQSVKREETRPDRDLDPEQPLAGRHGERKRTLRRTIVISKEPTRGKRLCPKWTWLAEGLSTSTRGSTSPPESGGKRAPVAASNGQQERSNQPGCSAGWSIPAVGGQTACPRLEGLSKKQRPLGKPGERLTLTRGTGR